MATKRVIASCGVGPQYKPSSRFRHGSGLNDGAGVSENDTEDDGVPDVVTAPLWVPVAVKVVTWDGVSVTVCDPDDVPVLLGDKVCVGVDVSVLLTR